MFKGVDCSTAMHRPIYLDHNATTPVASSVLDAMLPYFGIDFGNPSSRTHAFGWTADEAVTVAREQLAELVGCDPDRVTFTSGATEALNLAIKGVAANAPKNGRHIIISDTEHRAVLDTCRSLEHAGFVVTRIGVDAHGLLDEDELAASFRSDTILVAVIWANNETGVVQPVERIGALVRSRGAIFVSDATQAVGKIPVAADHADLIACSAHKFYGPKGIGALVQGGRGPLIRLKPVIDGGGQERGLRGGTLNTPGIVGFGAAAVLARTEMNDNALRLGQLRDRLESEILSRFKGAKINGAVDQRLPHTTNLFLPDAPVSKLIPLLGEVALSAGSACSSGSGKPSHVLKALGLTDREASSSIRIGLGRDTTADEIDRAIELIVCAVEQVQSVQIHHHKLSE